MAIDIIEAPTALTPAEARHLAAMEKRIAKGMQTFTEVGEALLDIRDQRLYRASHDTFESYLRDRWDMARDRAYQLMGAAEVHKVLPEGPVNEAQARELVSIVRNQGPEVARQVWAQVREQTESGGQPVTAQVVRQVARTVTAPLTGRPAEPSQTERLVGQVTSLVTAYTRWKASKPSRREKAVVTAAFEKLGEVTSG